MKNHGMMGQILGADGDRSAKSPERRSTTIRQGGSAIIRSVRSLALVSALAVLASCSPERGPADVPSSDEGWLPRSIDWLRSIEPESVRLDVTVNGMKVVDAAVVSRVSTDVELEPGILVEGINRVAIEFSYQVSGGGSRVLADASVDVLHELSTPSLSLSGIEYDYKDSDGDGIHDVHELGILPSDIDGVDGENVDDSDSDGDGVADGQDDTPYGPGSEGAVGALLHELRVESPGGTVELLRVDEVIGGSGETARLAGRPGAVRLRVPSGWPRGEVPADLQLRRWSAFELQTPEEDGLCSESRIVLDTSSLESTLSATSLLYFERPGGQGRLVPLRDEGVSDLDAFEREGLSFGDGPYNDALRMILVPYNTVGWIDLWSSSDLEGTVCSLNLSTPSVLRR